MSKELTLICIILLVLFADLLCVRQTLDAQGKMNSDWFSIVLSELIIAAVLIFCLVLFVRKTFFKKL